MHIKCTVNFNPQRLNNLQPQFWWLNVDGVDIIDHKSCWKAMSFISPGLSSEPFGRVAYVHVFINLKVVARVDKVLSSTKRHFKITPYANNRFY